MDAPTLSFAHAAIVAPDIVEIAIHEGHIVTAAMIDQLFSWMLSALSSSRCLLITKKHAYEYDFDAQMKIARFKHLKAIAVVGADNRWRSVAYKTISLLAPAQPSVASAVFTDREKAIAWLKLQQSGQAGGA